MTQYIDPTLLGIIPPMDLGRSTDIVPASLPPERISEFPLKLRTHNNNRTPVNSIGLFGARRGTGEGRLIRPHEGVDLLATSGTPVFAVQDGTIVNVKVDPDDRTGWIVIEHTQGFRYITFYSEIRNPRLIIFQRDGAGNIEREANGKPIRRSVFEGEAMEGQSVVQGDRIAETKDFSNDEDHLHFEIRYPFEQTGNSKSQTLAVDPTWALYAWEKKRYLNNDTRSNLTSPTLIQEFSEIVRGRLLRFLCIRVQGFDRNIYFPLGHMEDEDRSMVETLRWAFFHHQPLDLVWRDSLFFNQIEFPIDSNEKVPVLVEAKVRTF